MTESIRPNARNKLLDASEWAFAEFGFAGVGMKTIAKKAGVAQGLLHYHFGTKEGLYRAVIARRSKIINGERIRRLNAVDHAAPDALSRVLEALLAPPFDKEAVGLGYPRIFASLVVGDALDRELIREHYNPTATLFVRAIEAAIPDIDPRGAAWGYSFAIGALVVSLSNDRRAEELSEVNVNKQDEPDEIVRRLVDFCAAGIRQLA